MGTYFTHAHYMFFFHVQVRMLELESLLTKERQKLGRLRKAHYQIAAELGLIEQVCTLVLFRLLIAQGCCKFIPCLSQHV